MSALVFDASEPSGPATTLAIDSITTGIALPLSLPEGRKTQMSMRRIIVRSLVLTAVFWSVGLLGQPKPAVPSASSVPEFPVTMRQNVVAGKTSVGTKVQAKLAIATLLDGTVIPKGATFSGEVVESVAKSAADPSRLAIRMDSVQWKKGSAPIKVYLTAWFYPIRMPVAEDTSDEPPAIPIGRPRQHREGTYSNPNSPASRPFPGGDTAKSPDVTPDSPASSISNHRALMKDVESTSNSDGVVAITSGRFNIKLNKTTTYVLATGDLTPVK